VEDDKTIAIGVDIGGTFTDVILLDEVAGSMHAAKLLTTPGRLHKAVLAAVAEVLTLANARYQAVRTIVHGTTLATNAIIERKGASMALLTTRGFRDALETRTELRYDLYDLFIEFPEPLVERHRRLGITERVRFDGRLETPIVAAEVHEALRLLGCESIEAIAAVSCTPMPMRPTSRLRPKLSWRNGPTSPYRCPLRCCQKSANTAASPPRWPTPTCNL
jgi:5-oxoprolinase (ATP-hydrolysing)/N-methylhydantoinase A